MPRALYLLALAVFAMGTSEFMLPAWCRTSPPVSTSRWGRRAC